jgi:uncharacterized membrane protein YdjX (TVP38/TMEM64 family)
MDQTAEFVKYLGQAGYFGHVILCAALIFCSFTPFPRTALCLAGGLVLGMPAVVSALTGTVLGSVLAFLLARHFLRARFLRIVERRPVTIAIMQAVDMEGWRLVSLLSLGSLLPGSILNYCLGLTHLGIWRFTTATFVGVLPPTFLVVAMGAAGRTALTTDSGFPITTVFSVIGVGTMIVAMAVIRHRTKTILNASIAGQVDMSPDSAKVMD